MISAATGSRLKVIGSSIAIVAVAPMLGSTDRRAEHDADEAVEDVLRLQGCPQPEREVVEEVHPAV